MGEVQPLPHLRRELIADGARSQLRATWHLESGDLVLSLWRGEECVATSHLTPPEAGRLAGFLTGGLADLAAQGRGRRRTRWVVPGRQGRRLWFKARRFLIRYRQRRW